MPEQLSTLLAHFSPTQWLLIFTVMTLGSLIQGAVGFASGLFSIPLLVMGGVELQEAATINFLLTAVQNTVGAWRLREELTVRDAAVPVVTRWAGLPLGAIALAKTAALDQGLIKQIVGGLLLVTVIVLWLWKAKHRAHISLPTTILAFLTSGFLLGFAAIGGAPMVLYVNALDWSAAKCRAFLFLVSATGVPLMAVLLAINFGRTLLPAVVAAVMVLPVVWVGLHVGLHLGKKLDKPLFRRITFSLLTLIALTALLAPFLMEKSG
ncbi:MAG: sulfite exporter TauE/SafE family protein [Planctomycetales bacterium]|nr:sulfite exporter TauE/SafE family protein [Planctomycetales bacterium]